MEKERKDLIAAISVGVTWIDGRCLFKHHKAESQCWYGICHYSKKIFAITSLDYKKPLMISTLRVSNIDKYCDRAFTCLNFDCPLNRFDKDIYIKEFQPAYKLSNPDAESMGHTRKFWANFGNTTMWFNDKNYTADFWGTFIINTPESSGGMLMYNPEKGRTLSIGD